AQLGRGGGRKRGGSRLSCCRAGIRHGVTPGPTAAGPRGFEGDRRLSTRVTRDCDWRYHGRPRAGRAHQRCLWGRGDPRTVGQCRARGRRTEDARVDVIINGEQKRITGGTLLELLEELELDPRAVVVEH